MKVKWPHDPGNGGQRVLSHGERRKRDPAQLPGPRDRRETGRPEKPQCIENPHIT